uniref:Ionotropic glutamate receptor C-terminal domain-containing protein n=1 Tax=Anopheles albimanus TaxID=7167 RepID=A0A182F1C6_ANOAL
MRQSKEYAPVSSARLIFQNLDEYASSLSDPKGCHKSSQLKDLQGYVLQTSFIPSEADMRVIHTIMQTITSERNASFRQSFGLQASDLLNLSTSFNWQFTLLSLGPHEYATCFLVPRAAQIPIGYILVKPFDTSTWCCVVLSGTVVVLLLKRFGQSVNRSVPRALLTLLQCVFSSPNRISRSHFERRILTICMVSCLVLASSYQSIIVSLISNPAFYPELDTEAHINSSCALLMGNDNELGGMHFRNTFVDRASFKAGSSCVCSSCRLERFIRDHPQITTLYRISNLRMHPFPMLLALVDAHYPPFNALVEFYLARFLEAGITGKLLSDGKLKLSNNEKHARRVAQDPAG